MSLILKPICGIKGEGVERGIYENKIANVLIITEARIIGGGVPYITVRRIDFVFKFPEECC